MPEAMQPGVIAVQAEVQCQAARITDDYIRIGRESRSGTLRYRASASLHKPLPEGVERLLVVVHGALRDADNYFAKAMATAGEMAARTLIVAPQFLADVDLAGHPKLDPELEAGTLRWGVEGWKSGEPSLGAAGLSSFTVMDRLLGQLTIPDSWPSGRPPAVVIYGNSAGAQYVNRYAAVGRGPDRLAERGITVRFVLSNPSTYLWFNREHRWRYGFDGAPAYVEGDARENLRRYLARDVTIVLGREDRDGASLLLETHAAAMAQGANRYERGVRYHAYIGRLAREEGLEPRHWLIELDGVGHAAADVMAAGPVRDILFG